MDEKLDQMGKNINDLIEIVGAIKDNMATKQDLEEFKDQTEKNFENVNHEFEKVNSKIDGLQRATDSGFERQSQLEARISKIETEMHA